MIKKIKDKNVSLPLSDRVGVAATFIDRTRCETVHKKTVTEGKRIGCLLKISLHHVHIYIHRDKED